MSDLKNCPFCGSDDIDSDGWPVEDAMRDALERIMAVQDHLKGGILGEGYEIARAALSTAPEPLAVVDDLWNVRLKKLAHECNPDHAGEWLPVRVVVLENK